MDSHKLSRISIILTALALPAAMLTGALIGAILKGTNPDNVDISAGLAYLSPILIPSTAVLLTMLLASLALIVKIYSRSQSS